MKISSVVKKLFAQKSLLVKVLVSYIVVGSILLSILSYIMYGQYSKNSINEVEKISDAMLNQSYDIIETYWKSTVDYLSHLYFYSGNTPSTDTNMPGGLLFNALYSNVFDPIERGMISNKLSEIASSNPLIASVYIYNRQSDTVFSNTGTPQTSKDFFDQNMIDILNTHKFLSNMDYIPRKIKYSYAGKSVEYNAISVIFSDGSTNGENPDSALIFNLKQESLQNVVTPGSNDYSSEIFILDRDGMVISHPDSQLVNSSLKNEDYVARVLASDSSQGSFTTTIDGKRNLVIYRKSNSVFKWVFICKTDYAKLLSNTTALRKTIFIITLIFIILSFLIALAFAGNIFLPLYRVLRKIEGDTKKGADRPMNEIDLLSNTFDTLVNDVKQLKNSVRENLPVARNELLGRILSGKSLNIKEVEMKMSELGIRLQSDSYITVVLKLDSFKNMIQKHDSNDIAIFRFAILNVSEEIFGQRFMIEGTDGREDHVILIINTKKEGLENNVLIKSLLLSVQENICRYFDFTVTAVLGSHEQSLSGIHVSYENALWAYEYRMNFGVNALIDYVDVQQRNEINYVYPFEIEKQIIEIIKSGDCDKSGKLVETFIGMISGFMYEDILASITQLTSAAILTVKSTADMSGEKEKMDFKDIQQELSGFEDVNELGKWLKRFIERLARFIKEIRSSKYDEVAQMIMSYIDHNFQDSNMSVESIAEKVNLSPNYTRTIFKDKTGKSISGYISELRFGKAVELLKTTQYPANKISEMVGFQNSGYFYVAFRKYVGKTPDEYRRENT